MVNNVSQQLIELKNQDPMRNLSQDMYPRIVVDFDVKRAIDCR